MSIETSAGEEVDEWDSKDEEELIETDLIEFRGQRRWAFDKKIPSQMAVAQQRTQKLRGRTNWILLRKLAFLEHVACSVPLDILQVHFVIWGL